MPRITINKQTRDHVLAFLALGEHLSDDQGEEMTLDLCAETLILLGIRHVLDGLWRPQEPDIHARTLHLLAGAFPQQVLPFLAHIMREGGKPRGSGRSRRHRSAFARNRRVLRRPQSWTRRRWRKEHESSVPARAVP